MTKKITPEEVKALEIKKQRINKEMNSYSESINILKNKEEELNALIIDLKKDIESLEVVKDERKKEIENINDVILKKQSDRNNQEALMEEVLDSIKKEEKILKEIKEEQQKVTAELEGIIKKAGSLVSREQYVDGQEQYLKEQFKRVGIKYQSYA